MRAAELEAGYRRAYRHFYEWKSIVRGATAHGSLVGGIKHFAYASGWKKFERLWGIVIRAKRAGMMLPVLEAVLGADANAAPRRQRTSTCLTTTGVGSIIR